LNEKLHRYLLPAAPYLLLALLSTKLGQAVRLAPGTDFSGKALHIMEGLSAALALPGPSFHPADLCVGTLAAVLIRLAVWVKSRDAKKFRKNDEYGSARWGTAADIKPFIERGLKTTSSSRRRSA